MKTRTIALRASLMIFALVVLGCQAAQQPAATLSNPTTQPIVVQVTVPPQSTYTVQAATTQPSGPTAGDIASIAQGVGAGLAAATAGTPVGMYAGLGVAILGAVLGLFHISSTNSTAQQEAQQTTQQIASVVTSHNATVAGLTATIQSLSGGQPTSIPTAPPKT